MTSSDRALHGLQMLRAVAALLVVVHHALGMSEQASTPPISPYWLTLSGAAGVDIFFIISGFIMVYVSFAPGRPAPAPAQFLWNRVARIFPLYLLCTLALLAAIAVGFLANAEVTPAILLNSALLLPGEKLIFVAWTLSYEMYFYLVFAACLPLGRKSAVALAASAAILGLMLLGMILPSGVDTDFIGSPIVLEFLFGMALALAFRSRTSWPVAAAWAVPGMLAIFALTWATAPPELVIGGLEHGLRVLVWGVPSILIVAAALKVGAPVRWPGRFMVLLGDASYALYLSHIFIMIAYGWLLKRTALADLWQLPVVLGVVAVCIAFGLATHLIVEAPLNRLIRRATRARSRATAVA